MTKRIPLSDEQYNDLYEDHLVMIRLPEIIGEAIVRVARDRATLERQFWERIGRVAGVHPHEATVTIDWVNREVIVSEKLEEGGDD